MKSADFRVSRLVLSLSLACAMPAAAQAKRAQPVLTVPAGGMFAEGGSFAGTVSINRFERRNNQVVAIGFVSGVLSRGSAVIGSAVAGEVAWPVVVSSGGVVIARGREPGPAKPSLVAFSPRVRTAARYVPAQATSCPVLDVALAPLDVNLLGFDVALGGITLNIGGEAGTPVGDLVCAASDLLGQVAAVVRVLNALLGLVTGLLGGLLGGLGGLGGALPAA